MFNNKAVTIFGIPVVGSLNSLFLPIRWHLKLIFNFRAQQTNRDSTECSTILKFSAGWGLVILCYCNKVDFNSPSILFIECLWGIGTLCSRVQLNYL